MKTTIVLIGVEMIDEVDYQQLFEVMRKENERLRMTIVELKDHGYGFIDGITERWDSLKSDPLFGVYLLIASWFVFDIIIPLGKWIIKRYL